MSSSATATANKQSFFKNPYLLSAITVYMIYFMHSMTQIMVSQFKDVFTGRWDTTLAGVMSVMTWNGFGKFISMAVAGEVSDHIGRKPMILIGISGYIIFFSALLFSTNLTLIMVAGFIAGVCNSILDGSCYPTLQESFPSKAGSAVVVVKGVISVGQMILPLLIGVLIENDLWFGWAIVVPFAFGIVNFLLTAKAVFAYDKQLKDSKAESGTLEERKAAKKKAEAEAAAKAKENFVSQPKFAIEGVCCIIFGFVSMMTFFIISQIITMYGKDFIGMGEMPSRFLMTLYTIGSLAAVLISSAIMAKGMKTVAVLLIFTAGSLISLAALAFFPNAMVANIGSFAGGFFAAGGALQAGIALMGDFFPGKKGRNIGIYYTTMGLATYVGPIIIGKMSNLQHVMMFDVAVAALGLVLMIIVSIRYTKVFGKKVFSFQ